MRMVLVFAGILVLTGCATRLPTTEATPVAAPTKDLASRFVRCEAEGMTREHEVEEERFRHHKINLFMGYTGERGNAGGQTVGVDYLYRFDEHWGVGVFLDFAAGGLETGVLGAGLDYHPIEPVFLFVGPGVESVEGEHQGLLRVGGGYEFEVGERMALGPAAYIDFLENGEFAWVVGLILGYSF